MEVDWNSLFESFFEMVRVKICCKEVSKIPKKRLFEMKQNLYLIQFKIEGKAGLDGDDMDGDGYDPGDGDNNGFEETENDLHQDFESSAEQKQGEKGGT
jgi:hypothetical protein